MPKNVDHDERRAAVAEAVWSLLQSRGVDALTVREVAREAGVSTGLLSHYFASKDELLTYAMDLAFERAAERMVAVGGRGPGLEALRAICLENMPLDAKRRTEYHAWLYFWSRAASQPALSEEHARRYELWRASIEMLIDRGQGDGSIRTDCSPAEEAQLLAAFIDGIGLQATLEPSRLGPKPLSTLLDTYLQRLRA